MLLVHHEVCFKIEKVYTLLRLWSAPVDNFEHFHVPVFKYLYTLLSLSGQSIPSIVNMCLGLVIWECHVRYQITRIRTENLLNQCVISHTMKALYCLLILLSYFLLRTYNVSSEDSVKVMSQWLLKLS